METAQQWIDELELTPHPEGGYFVQTDLNNHTYVNNEKNFPLYTSIYYLLTEEKSSHFHQLFSNELWFFHAGNPLTVHSLNADGSYTQVHLGLDFSNETRLYQTVSAGTIFGLSVETGFWSAVLSFPDSIAQIQVVHPRGIARKIYRSQKNNRKINI